MGYLSFVCIEYKEAVGSSVIRNDRDVFEFATLGTPSHMHVSNCQCIMSTYVCSWNLIQETEQIVDLYFIVLSSSWVKKCHKDQTVFKDASDLRILNIFVS